MPNEERKKDLEHLVTLPDISEMKRVAKILDVEKGGHFDGRLGAINIWCSPSDKPLCWNEEIKGGKFLLDFVGTIRWEEVDNGFYQLYLEATPFELLEDGFSGRWDTILPEDYEIIFHWMEEKVETLLQLSKIK